MANTVTVGGLYPVATEDRYKLPAGVVHRLARVAAKGEFRKPRAGEWFLSGGIVEGYYARHDMTTAYHIGILMVGTEHTHITWEPVD